MALRVGRVRVAVYNTTEVTCQLTGFVMAAADLVVAFTGASGAPYGVRLLEVLLHAGRTVHLTLSPAAVEVIERELNRTVQLGRFELRDLLGDSPALDFADRVFYHDYRNFQAGIASGSFLTGGMVVCPCSMGTVGAIAHGLSQNLIHRAADVHLKEKRRLVLVPRETPLHLIQLRSGGVRRSWSSDPASDARVLHQTANATGRRGFHCRPHLRPVRYRASTAAALGDRGSGRLIQIRRGNNFPPLAA